MLYTTNKLELEKNTEKKIELNGNNSKEIMESIGNCLLKNIIIMTKNKNCNWYISMLMVKHRFEKFPKKVIRTRYFNIMTYVIQYLKSTGNNMVNIYSAHHMDLLDNNFIEIIKILFIFHKDDTPSIEANKKININSFNGCKYNEQIDIVDSISIASHLVDIKHIKDTIDNINKTNDTKEEMEAIFYSFFKIINNIYNKNKNSYDLYKLFSIINIIERIYKSIMLYYFSGVYCKYNILYLLLKHKFTDKIPIDCNFNFNSITLKNNFCNYSSQIFNIILSITDIEINKKLLYLIEKINNNVIIENKFIDNIFDYDYYHINNNCFNICPFALKKEKIPIITQLINEKYNKYHNKNNNNKNNNNCHNSYCNIM